MFEMLGWVLFGIMLIWFFAFYRHSHQKRLNLNYYIVYLLLNDEIRKNHKLDFEKWIRESEANDAMSLSLQAYSVIENMSDRLADAQTSSALGAHGMIWNYKQETGK